MTSCRTSLREQTRTSDLAVAFVLEEERRQSVGSEIFIGGWTPTTHRNSLTRLRGSISQIGPDRPFVCAALQKQYSNLQVCAAVDTRWLGTNLISA